ncbi:CesT family type III secretion system chaperone [Brenneria goodwinii]|uniref:CesT family type III secretion system chaperone n=1 Tax=Brenneria goodwinii TaxID=1109412 RepID=UPI0036F18D3B
MSGTRGFHIVMSKLMKRYQVDAQKAAESGHDVYIITLEDEMQILLLGNQRDYLNIMSPVTSLAPHVGARADVLLSLLSMNMWNTKHPVFNIGLDVRNMQVVLSCRQALAELDETETYKLVSSFIDTASKLKAWINKLVDSSAGK